MKKPPKVSRRKIGSKPRMNVWRQMTRRAAREIMEQEDATFLLLVGSELFPDLVSHPGEILSPELSKKLEELMLEEDKKWRAVVV